MKILIIRYEELSVNGENTYVNSLVNALTENGHEVFYIILIEEKIREDFINDFNLLCQTAFIPVDFSSRNKISFLSSQNIIDFGIYNEVRKYVVAFQPDIIHIHNLKFTKSVLLASRGFSKVQTLHDLRAILPLYPHFFNINGKMYYDGKIKLRTILFDYFIFGNKRIKKNAINYFICPSKYLVNMSKSADFKNSIYLPYFNDISNKNTQTKLNIFIEKNFILFVGRLDKIKGVDYLLKAFKITNKKNKSLKLIIIGDGSERENLEELSRSLKVNKFVKFLGNVNNSELGKYYSASIGIVIPSVYPETSPLVALEAMNFSKPIIAFNSGGLSDLVIDGYNGYLVEKFDTEKLALKIGMICNNRKDSVKMGKNGRILSMDVYSKDKHISNLLNVYRSVINGSKNG